MEIQTTINMNKTIIIELGKASSQLHMSRSYLIRLLLKQFLDDSKKIQVFNSPVKYQSRDSKCNWSKFHLTLREDEYECCLDLRKIYKMSLSAIIAFSVKKYLKNVIAIFSTNSIEKIYDIYLYRNYLFSFNIIDGITCINIYWGITDFQKLLTDNYQNII
ncbi:MAG TPA: hypothetical protein PLD91_10205 [Spirochaetota bacterium]|nr:hypothetical protein [Spirochaetota bacterium]HRT74539.1 hypothetical protein [Spirochaetota bacterium]